MGIIAFLVSYPVIFMLVGSFMDNGELARHLSPVLSEGSNNYASFAFIPEKPNVWSYVRLLFDTPQYFVVFWNSVKVAVFTLVGQCVFGIMAAWGFAAYKFPLKKILFNFYIFFMLMPFQVLMLSEYIVIKNMNLMDTLWAIILPSVFSTFSVFILYYFFREIPEEVLEAARLDGASEFKIFTKIAVPMGKAGISSMLVLSFLEVWNLVEQPIAFLKDQTKWTLSIYFTEVSTENIGISMVSAVVAFLPALYVFYIGKDYLEGGIVAATAVRQKGERE